MKISRWFSKVALVLFVFALIPLLGYAQPQDRPGRIERFLDLTPEQQAKLEEFRKSGAEERQAHFEKMRKLREDLRAAMEDPETSEGKINGLIDEMAKLRADQMKRGLARNREMKKIFTPEQQEKLARLRDRMADRSRGRFSRGGRDWQRRGLQRRPFSDFGWRHPRMDRRPRRW